MAYLSAAQRDAFGRDTLDDIVHFFGQVVEPDQVYTRKQLFKCLVEHHRGFLLDEVNKLDGIQVVHMEAKT